MIWFDRCYYTTHAREDRLCVQLRKKLVFYIELISLSLIHIALLWEDKFNLSVRSGWSFKKFYSSNRESELSKFRNFSLLLSRLKISEISTMGRAERWNFHRFENCLLRFDVWIWKALSRRINSFSWKFWKLRLPVFCLQSTIRSANLSLNCFGEHSRTVTEQTVFNCV